MAIDPSFVYILLMTKSHGCIVFHNHGFSFSVYIINAYRCVYTVHNLVPNSTCVSTAKLLLGGIYLIL